MVTPINGNKLAVLQKLFSAQGMSTVKVVSTGVMQTMPGIDSLKCLPNLHQELTRLVKTKFGIEVTEIFCDREAKLEILGCNPPFVERVRNANGNPEVLGHMIVIEMEDENSGKLYFLRSDKNVGSMMTRDVLLAKIGAVEEERTIQIQLDALRFNRWGTASSNLAFMVTATAKVEDLLFRLGPQATKIVDDQEYFIVDQFLLSLCSYSTGGEKKAAEIIYQMAKKHPDCAAIILERNQRIVTSVLMQLLPESQLAEVLATLDKKSDVLANILVLTAKDSRERIVSRLASILSDKNDNTN